MQNSVAAFFSWKFKENKDSKFDNNFNTSNMTWVRHLSINYVSRGTFKYIHTYQHLVPNYQIHTIDLIYCRSKEKTRMKKTPFSVDMIIMFQIWFMTGKWQKLTEKKWSISSSRAGFQYSALALGAAAAAAAVSTLKMTWFKFHPLRFSVWLRFGVVWAGPVGPGVTRAAPDLYR